MAVAMAIVAVLLLTLLLVLVIADVAEGSRKLRWLPQPAIEHLSQSRSLVSADFDRDGHMDVAVTNYQKNTYAPVQWVKNDGNGAFLAKNVFTIGKLRKCHTLTAADVDSDGYIDLISSSQNQFSPSVGWVKYKLPI